MDIYGFMVYLVDSGEIRVVLRFQGDSIPGGPAYCVQSETRYAVNVSYPDPEDAYSYYFPRRPTSYTNLYFEAGWEINDIILQLNLTRRQVKYAIEHRPIP